MLELGVIFFCLFVYGYFSRFSTWYFKLEMPKDFEKADFETDLTDRQKKISKVIQFFKIFGIWVDPDIENQKTKA